MEENPLSVTRRVIDTAGGSGNPGNPGGCRLEGRSGEASYTVALFTESRGSSARLCFHTAVSLAALLASAVDALSSSPLPHTGARLPSVVLPACYRPVLSSRWDTWTGSKPKDSLLCFFLITFLLDPFPKPVWNLAPQTTVLGSVRGWHRGQEGRAMLIAWASVATDGFVLWNHGLLVLMLLCPQEPLQLIPQLMATALW